MTYQHDTPKSKFSNFSKASKNSYKSCSKNLCYIKPQNLILRKKKTDQQYESDTKEIFKHFRYKWGSSKGCSIDEFRD